MRRALSAFAMTVSALVLAPASVVAADTFVAPPDVAAQADGSFSYDVRFVKGPGSTLLAGGGWNAQENVTGGFVGDCFCGPGCALDPGERIEFQVTGELVDPLLPGRVEEWLALCDGGTYSLVTNIHPFPAASVPDPAAMDGSSFWNEPNPFSGRTTFRYTVPETGPVSLRIHDIAGRLVASVVDGIVSAGPHGVTWDAQPLRSLGASGGVFFARLSMGGVVRSRALIFVR
jgi:hypothetical protein